MLLKYFLIFCICALPLLGNAQIFGKQNVNPHKIQIGLSTTGYSFFDGFPVFHNDLSDNHSYLVKTRGFELLFFISEKNGIKISYNNVDIFYAGSSLGFQPVGTIVTRTFRLVSSEYTRLIIHSHFFKAFLLSGISYRYGTESYLVGYGSFDIFAESKLLKDLGLSIGSIITIPIVKGLNTNIGLKYTGFVYRNDTGGSIYYDDNGSSQHMFAISFGIGYAFSFKKKQKGFTD